MGAGASINLTEEEVNNLTAEQLALFAKEKNADDIVVSTIKKENIHGKLAYELEDEDLKDMVKGLNYKRLTSALHTLKSSEDGATTRGGGGGTKPKTKEHSMLTSVFQSYSEHSYTLIFACNKYPKEKTLKNLDCAVVDCKLMEKTLKAHGFHVLRFRLQQRKY